mgnify:CR=1 FL=1
MLKRERQAIILHKINLHNKILSTELCKEMGVSEDTMRRDLQELSDQGKLIKVHGGALSHSFSQVNFMPSTVYSQANKAIIAKKAASLIKDGMFVLTSGGTTILELARALPPGLKATFICGSIPTVLPGRRCTTPELGSWSPAMRRSTVDLPAPLWPMTPILASV